MPSSGDNIYFYNPSFGAAIFFAVLYFLLFIWHFFLSIVAPRRHSEKHRYTVNLFIATTVSTLGFAIRVASVKDNSDVGLYASSATLIIISPIFVCACLYLLLAHQIRRCFPAEREQKQILFGVNAKWLGRVFITSDVFSFLMQGSGSGIAASDDWTGSNKDAGVSILIAGLAIQLVTFTLFLGLMRRLVARRVDDDSAVSAVIKGIWIAAACVETRSIYRLIEFGLGIKGYLFRHEWALYVFEALPMFVALVVMGWYHPVQWLQTRKIGRKTTRDTALQV